jgi:hypothetical protein
MPSTPSDKKSNELVPDPQVAREFGVTPMSIWRWDRDPRLAELGWPPAVKIRHRNFRLRRELELFKARLWRDALAKRAEG